MGVRACVVLRCTVLRRRLLHWRAIAQSGYTALRYAAENGRADCVRLLLEAGADTEARTNVRACAVWHLGHLAWGRDDHDELLVCAEAWYLLFSFISETFVFGPFSHFKKMADKALFFMFSMLF